jgi:rSAM/selenodomain-associated transferase 2
VLVSIVVPVLDEAPIIRAFLEHLRAVAPAAEIIVVDGGSTDGTLALCHGLADQVMQTTRGRARQMNAGAQIAHGEVFWFVHADSRIAANSLAHIESTLRDAATVGGCFRLEIVPRRWIYRIRDALGDGCVDMFKIALGDRGFFCHRESFFAAGQYPDQPLLEDADFYCQLRRLGRVERLSAKIQTSARRYEALGPIRTSLFYLLVMTLYFLGARMSFLEKLVRWFSVKQARNHNHSQRGLLTSSP